MFAGLARVVTHPGRERIAVVVDLCRAGLAAILRLSEEEKLAAAGTFGLVDHLRRFGRPALAQELRSKFPLRRIDDLGPRIRQGVERALLALRRRRGGQAAAEDATR